MDISPPAETPRLARLRVLADMLEASLAEATVGVRAQLAAQYRATLAEIDELAPPTVADQPRTAVDEVNARRAARESRTARPA